MADRPHGQGGGMIRLPKGRILQRNIDTTYVRLDGVLHSLGQSNFTGYVRVVGERTEGVLFFRDAHLVAGLFEHGEDMKGGPEALVEILALAGGPRAFLDICSLEHDLLSAVLAVTHSAPDTLGEGATPADMAGLLAAAEEGQLTGAYLAETASGSHYFYAAGGELLGEYRPDLEEWTDVPAVLPVAIAPWRRWHHPEAVTLRTIDLEAQKSQAWEAVSGAVERYVPGFGAHLLRLELQRYLIADPRRMLKAEFVLLVDELRKRARLVIGDRRAALLHAEAAAVTAGVIDAGI